MNRRQRRSQAKVGMVDLRTIVYPWQMTNAECAAMLADRCLLNLKQTGHPFHHLTANAVIVDTDPTLEYYMSRIDPEKRERIRDGWLAEVRPDAKKAIPVNRTYYGPDPYEGR